MYRDDVKSVYFLISFFWFIPLLCKVLVQHEECAFVMQSIVDWHCMLFIKTDWSCCSTY